MDTIMKRYSSISSSSQRSYRGTVVLGRSSSCSVVDRLQWFPSMSKPPEKKRLCFTWKVLWRRLLKGLTQKEKKKKTMMFSRSSSSSVKVFSYEPYDYSLNFDQGPEKNEPENLSRSFSARFADPTRTRMRRALLFG